MTRWRMASVGGTDNGLARRWAGREAAGAGFYQMSRNTQFCAVERHPILRTAYQAVVDVVQQAVEDPCGEDLVVGEDLGPVSHVLVRREDDRALLVARAHQAEEEIGFDPVEGPEADLVDDEQRTVQVAFGLESPRRDRGVALRASSGRATRSLSGRSRSVWTALLERPVR